MKNSVHFIPYRIEVDSIFLIFSFDAADDGVIMRPLANIFLYYFLSNLFSSIECLIPRIIYAFVKFDVDIFYLHLQYRTSWGLLEGYIILL